MTMNKQNLSKLFATITQYFSPKIIAEVNDVYIKLAKVKGQDVPWHTHDKEDELFYVIKGQLNLEIKDKDRISLNTGELYTVKTGVEHRVHCEEECWLMLIEHKSTQHTGGVKASITKSIEEQKY
jgi:quercetin dioxygenase-like cupin family protein